MRCLTFSLMAITSCQAIDGIIEGLVREQADRAALAGFTVLAR